MRRKSGRFFPVLASALVFSAVALAGHPNINGTWKLNPTRSNFAGEPAVETGTVTISDRQHHILISRSFNFDNESGGFDYSFTTDGAENSTIRKGQTFKSKAKWDGDTLKVKTTRDNLTTTEHYSLSRDGLLTLMVERSNHPTETLLFQRQ